MIKNKRLEWIDRMRGIAIFSVVIQHLSIWLYANNYDFVYLKLIGISNMAVFFFISAYISEYTTHITNIKEGLYFLLKRTVQLMIPFFVWSLVIPHYFFQQNWEIITIKEIINQIENPHLWFLLTLYGYSYLFVICKILKQTKYEWAIWFFLFFIIFICNHYWGLFHNATLYLPYFIIGTLSCQYSKIENLFTNKLVVFLAFLSIALVLPFWTSGATSIINIAIKLLVASATIIITYNCCLKFTWSKYINKFILMCGKYSLAIYVAHWTFLPAVVTKFTIIQNELIAFIPVLAFATIICMTCIAAKKIVSLCPIFDICLFGNTSFLKALKK